MPVSFRHLGRLIRLGDNGSRFQDRRVGAQSHAPAQVGLTRDDIPLIGHGGDHRIRRVRLEFGGVGLAQAHRAGRLDHDALQPQTQPQQWQPTVAGVPDGADLSFDPADPETTRNQHRVHVGECCGRRTVDLGVTGGRLAVIGCHPAHFDFGAVGEPAGPQRLGHRQVGIGEVDVFTHQRDSHRLLRIVHPAQQVIPGGPIDIAERQVQPPHDVGVEFLTVQHLGDVVDGRRIRRGDHPVDVHVAHQRDLLLEPFRHIAIATQDQRVRGDADAAQGGHRVLGGFGLQLPRRRQIRDQRDVQKKAVLPADLMANLTGGFQERLGFDIADGAADLRDDDVWPISLGVRLGHLQDAAFDLIGDVWDHLHGIAEVLPAAFPGDDFRIHLAGGHIRRTGQIPVQEALIVADVEVGLGSVLGHEHLAVLERIHRSRIDVEVRVEFLHGHLQSASGQQLPETAGGQAFAERGDDATGDEDVLGGSLRVLAQCGQEQPP